ncbi:MAG: hypothetical protein QOJ71_3051 [Actinomycetota bacterium]|nr:hypothetical protein [Actinomycetota bacterium]
MRPFACSTTDAGEAPLGHGWLPPAQLRERPPFFTLTAADPASPGSDTSEFVVWVIYARRSFFHPDGGTSSSGALQNPLRCMTGSRMSRSAFIPAWLGWTGYVGAMGASGSTHRTVGSWQAS